MRTTFTLSQQANSKKITKETIEEAYRKYVRMHSIEFLLSYQRVTEVYRTGDIEIVLFLN